MRRNSIFLVCITAASSFSFFAQSSFIHLRQMSFDVCFNRRSAHWTVYKGRSTIHTSHHVTTFHEDDLEKTTIKISIIKTPPITTDRILITVCRTNLRFRVHTYFTLSLADQSLVLLLQSCHFTVLSRNCSICARNFPSKTETLLRS